MRGFGLCTATLKEESPREFIGALKRCQVAASAKALQMGCGALDIANGEYDLDALPIITDDDVLKFKETATVSDNVVNGVSVKSHGPERKESVITPPVRAMGLLRSSEIHQTFEYPEIPTGRIYKWPPASCWHVLRPRVHLSLTPGLTVYALRRNQYVRFAVASARHLQTWCA